MGYAAWISGAAALAVVAGAPAIAADKGKADLSSVKSVEYGLIKTTKLDDAMQYYAPDGVLIDAFAPGFAMGDKEMREAFGWQFANVAASKGSFVSYNQLQHGNLACVASQQHFHTTMKDGKTMDSSVRIVDVLRRKDGKWQIILENVSFPMDVKTGMGVMDAKLQPLDPPLVTKGAFAGPGVSEDQAKTEIHDWLIDDTKSMTAEQAFGHYGPGDAVLVFDQVAPGTVSGQAKTLAAWQPQFAGIKTMKVDVTKSGIETDGTFGAVYSLQHVDIVMKDGSKHVFDMRQVNCLHRKDGKWYSIVEENSLPVDPKTGKVVFKQAAK